MDTLNGTVAIITGASSGIGEGIAKMLAAQGVKVALVARRHNELERVAEEIRHQGATVITSNKSLASWGELVGDTALMMAIIDRLLHHGEVFYVRGSSYRLRGKEVLTLGPKGETLAATEKL